MFEKLEEFINYNKDKKVVVVQGLGFVGSVMSLVCANSLSEDYAVIGVDLATEKSLKRINDFNNGSFPLVADDPKIEIFFQNSRDKRNFYATADPVAFEFADVVIVDVNLDVDKSSSENLSLNNFNVNLDNFRNAISTLGIFCQSNALIIVETTVPPGTCENVVKPILIHEFSKRNLDSKNLKIGHSYERVMPGPEYIDSIRNYPRVYSGIDENSAIETEKFLKTIIDTSLCELTKLNCTTASEMAKVLENSYRATNIAFAVEWSRFAEEAGVNLWKIVDAIRVRKTHSNLMFPNIGVGGYCLTKDPLLASWARTTFFGSKIDLEMSINSVSINDQMPFFAYQRLKSVFGQINEQKVAFLGVSYRGDVGDSRYSPVETLYRLIKSDTCYIKIHDPYILRWNELDLDVSCDLDDVLTSDRDLIIISTAHSCYNSEELITKILCLPKCKIFDAVGLFNEKQILSLKSKHDFSLIGCGDFN
tara:strand:- start:386 stop:1819 length:1434 start_codon:yes stop_codon:yes gene_type:complete